MAIRINLEDLLTARESNDLYMHYFLDLETGKVLLGFEEGFDPIPDEPSLSEMEDNERYLPIRPLESSIAYSIMEDFVNELPMSEAKDELLAALAERKPFRNFKNVIGNYPDLENRWRTRDCDEQVYWAKWWIRKESIEAEYDE